jgi:hypothetical protein
VVYILADARRDEVEQWLQKLSPDESPEASADDAVCTILQLRPGMKVFVAWWD